MTSPRIRRLGVLAALAAALFVTACTGADGADSPESDTANAADGYPVTITHAYGETVIPEKPERVVTDSWMNHDVVAALGVAPVAVAESWGGDEEGFTPWFRDQIENELGAEMPAILNVSEDGLDYEQILELDPDIIVAVYSGLTETDYERLSEIAPTIPFIDRAFTVPSWQEHTEVIGEALGESARAAELIEETETLIAAEAERLPNLAGSSFIYSLTLADGDGGTELAAYISEDPRAALLHEFGMVDSPALASASEGIDDDAFYTGISLEELDSVEADVVVAWSNSAEDTAYTIGHPVVSRWAPIADGHYFITENATLGMATSGPDVLSIPWAIKEGYIEDISRAIDGDAVVHQAE